MGQPKPKDRVIAATDLAAEAITILIRINYDSQPQQTHNIDAALSKLIAASNILKGA